MACRKGDEPPLSSNRPDLYDIVGACWEPDEGHVGASIQETTRRVGPRLHAQLEPPVRVQLTEAGDDGLIEAIGEGRIPCGKEPPGTRQERFPGRRQLDATAIAAEERKAQLLLELADLLGEGGLRDMKSFGRSSRFAERELASASPSMRRTLPISAWPARSSCLPASSRTDR